MGDLATWSTQRGLERVWVPSAEESEWIARFGRMGIAACRWRDYQQWGCRFYPPPPNREISGNEKLRPPLRPAKRKRTSYARWTPPQGY